MQIYQEDKYFFSNTVKLHWRISHDKSCFQGNSKIPKLLFKIQHVKKFVYFFLHSFWWATNLQFWKTIITLNQAPFRESSLNFFSVFYTSGSLNFKWFQTLQNVRGLRENKYLTLKWHLTFLLIKKLKRNKVITN